MKIELTENQATRKGWLKKEWAERQFLLCVVGIITYLEEGQQSEARTFSKYLNNYFENPAKRVSRDLIDSVLTRELKDLKEIAGISLDKDSMIERMQRKLNELSENYQKPKKP